ncbi:unnamed protein product [Microthlaspi erraticum]|uniref:Peptidase A1 domain-containing protein n=1 Tax=Microthlaspi erraticum TaxID=1685480 RepID=A0A6D2KVK7_9BRAS|nr:unnamed protein product [Microthlaspi erraticum]
MLPTAFYSKLEAAVASSIKAERKKDPESGLSLCYNANADVKDPNITIHFDGADVKLNIFNSFVQVSKDLVCFAFLETEGDAIYGNLSQMDFLVGYDTVSKMLSFKPADCAKM